jgi:glycine hydroxymethyltransferase
VLPERSEALIAAAERLFDSLGPSGTAAHVRELVVEHDRWREGCLNLLAAEGLMSRDARRLLDSGLATRVSEGVPGDKDRSTSPPQADRFVDQLEALVIALARRLFAASHVEWRAVSNTMANAIALRALARPGDTILVQPMSAGANVSYQDDAVAGLLGLRTVKMPGTYDFGIDTAALGEIVLHERPRCIVFGGSKVLFPYPVAAIRAAADEVGAHVIYDAAHVGPLIAGGLFGDPLREGAHVLITGTHKIMGGPVGGLILTEDAEIARRVHGATYPAFLQSRDQNKYAASAVALAEMLEHVEAYAAAVVQNAQQLARSLHEAEFEIVGAADGFTRTHQVVIDAGAAAVDLAARSAEARILITPTNIFGEHRTQLGSSGVRASVVQVTRQGMGPEQMERIAELIATVGQGASPKSVGADAEALARAYAIPGYAFG